MSPETARGNAQPAPIAAKRLNTRISNKIKSYLVAFDKDARGLSRRCGQVAPFVQRLLLGARRGGFATTNTEGRNKRENHPDQSNWPVIHARSQFVHHYKPHDRSSTAE